LKDVLRDARNGQLETGWRERHLSERLGKVLEWRPPSEFDVRSFVQQFPLEEVLAGKADPLAPLAGLGSAREEWVADRYFTMLEVASCQVEDWEPGASVGVRQALDAWYGMSLRCVDEDEAEIPNVPPGKDQLGAQLAWHMAPTVARMHWQCTCDRDLLTESYEAGLASLTGDRDWVSRSRERVSRWPDLHGVGGTVYPTRDEQLWRLDDFSYQASRELLPPYWGST
jgi:hypothetical protein